MSLRILINTDVATGPLCDGTIQLQLMCENVCVNECVHVCGGLVAFTVSVCLHGPTFECVSPTQL